MINILLLVFSLASLLLNSFGFYALSYTLVVLCFIYLLHEMDERNLFQFMWIISIFVFALLPHFFWYISGEIYDVQLLLIIFLFSLLVFRLTDGYIYVGSKFSSLDATKNIYSIGLLFILGGLLVTSGESFQFTAPLMVMVVGLSFSKGLSFRAIINFVLYVLFMLSYIFFYWDGFGRLTLAASVIPLVLIIHYELKWMVRKYIYLIAIVGSGVFMTFLRIQDESLLNALYQDSMMGPYRLTLDIFDNPTRSEIDFLGWVEQFLVYVYAIFPRELWPSKPFGFGREYVLQEMSAMYIDSGHSIAALFLGEHSYYLLNWWLVGAIASVLIFVVIFRFMHSVDNFSGVFSVIFCMWIPSYVWGGINIFSVRLHLGVMALIFVYFSIRMLRVFSRVEL